MSRKQILSPLTVLVFFCALLASTALCAQFEGGPTFTTISYQGLLRSSGLPANGAFNMDFKLFTSSAGSTQVGDTNSFLNVSVTDGLFSRELDFGANAYSGPSPRWLEIIVDGTILSPRQAITSAPHSVETRGIFVDASNRVTVGMNAPNQPFTVLGNSITTGTLVANAVSATTLNASGSVSGSSVNAQQYNILGNRVLSNGGSGNLFVGLGAGQSNAGVDNTLIGEDAGMNVTGNRSVFVGGSAGINQTAGNDNTYIGYLAGPPVMGAIFNATAIGSKAQVMQSDSVVLGSINGVNGASGHIRVAIGTSMPDATLSVRGNHQNLQTVRFEGQDGNFRFLQQLDGSDQASWTFRNGSAGVAAMSITADGRIGMNVNSIDARLHVVGSNTRIAKFDRFGSDGELVGFARNDVVQGNISVSGGVVSYNAFTGSHYAWCDTEPEPGALMTLTGENTSLHADGTGEIVYGVAPSATANDSACLGSYVSTLPMGDGESARDVRLVSAAGNGEMWVIDTGTNLDPGDLLISSTVPGCAMLDDPARIAVGHIVARAAEAIDWSRIDADRVKISVLFDPFTRGSMEADSLATKVAQLEQENAEQRERNNELEARLARIEGRLNSQ